MNLAFKYQDSYYPFLSISRQTVSIVVNIDYLPLKTAYQVDDMHITYPADGKVHLTLTKKGFFKVEVSVDGIKVKNLDRSISEVALRQSVDHLAMFAKQGLPLSSFKSVDITFPFPTYAAVSFPLEDAFINKFFTQVLPHQKYNIVDISDLVSGVINVVVCLRGADASWVIDPGAKILSKEVIKGDPVIEVMLLHYSSDPI
jgi:hypothetical protein